MNIANARFCFQPQHHSPFKEESSIMRKEASSIWDVVGAALLAMAIPLFILIGLGMAALFGKI
jgi:hypothetical protein